MMRNEKVSPALRTLTDYITGGHGAVITGETVSRSYEKLNEREKELYRQKLIERHAALKKLTDGVTKQYGLEEDVRALGTVTFIAKIIGVNLEATQ